MSFDVDFATALTHPDTDGSAWAPEEFLALSQRQSWPRRHDFELGRSQPVTAGLFADAEARIQETTRVVAARMLLLHGDKAVGVLGLDLLEAALCGTAIMSGSVVNGVADLAGDGWRPLITQAALGPGHTRLKIEEADWVSAQRFLDDYVSTLFAEDEQNRRALNDPFAELLEFAQVHGRVPVGDERQDLHLWCAEQRRRFRRGLMSEEEAASLAALPGWAWYFPGGNNQEQGLLRVVEFTKICATHKTCLVPFDTRLSDGATLSGWLRDRRRQYAHGKMTSAIAQLFEALPDWSWDHDYWEEGVALRELREVAEKHGSVADCLTGRGLTRAAGVRVRAWYGGSYPARGPAVLDDLPGWSWQVQDDARETVRSAILALHLSRASLTPMQLDITTNRLLATSPDLLQVIANRYNVSREAVRQEEAKILSKVHHPVIVSGVRRDLRVVGLSDDVLNNAVESREQATRIAQLRSSHTPTVAYAESVLSVVLGRPLPAGCLDPSPSCRPGPSPISSITVLHGSAPATRTLRRHGIRTLTELAFLDPIQVRSWAYMRHGTLLEIMHMIEAARAIVTSYAGSAIPPTPRTAAGGVTARSITDLRPSTRALNVLTRQGILEISALVALDIEDAASWQGVGAKLIAELTALKEAAIGALAESSVTGSTDSIQPSCTRRAQLNVLRYRDLESLSPLPQPTAVPPTRVTGPGRSGGRASE